MGLSQVMSQVSSQDRHLLSEVLSSLFFFFYQCFNYMLNVNNRPCVCVCVSVFILTHDETSATELSKYTQSNSEIVPLYCTAQLNLAAGIFFL